MTQRRGRQRQRQRGRSIVELGASEHYEDAILYDYEYRRRRKDANFYCSLAKRFLEPNGWLLELACGSGRVTTILARKGFQVIGMDSSASMLERASARIERLGQVARSRAHVFRADMRRFAIARRFPLIIAAFNSFEHLYTRVEVEQTLAMVHSHLEPGGRFAFDVQNPDLRWLCRDPEKRWSRTKFRHPTLGVQMEYTTNHDYDPVSQIALIRLYYDPVETTPGPPGLASRGAHVVNLSQRKFFPAELEALLFANGFDVEGHYGDFEDEPLHGDAESQVLVCRARHGRSQSVIAACDGQAEGE